MVFISKKRKKPFIALIADEHTANGLAPEAELIHLTPLNWRWLLRFGQRPDYLLVESAWRGHHSRWRGRIVDYGKDDALVQIVDYCHKRNIPTIFWNKEDPVCNNRFIGAAKLFDIVYTTDEDSIKSYQQIVDKQFHYIGVLQFAAQPVLHYPDPNQKQLPGIAFAGGYYGKEYPQRSALQKEILISVTNAPLTIYDRFWQQGMSCSFPRELKHFCQPALPALDVVNLYRRHRVHLNFNTVTNSTTMLSRRVFELAACAIPIISTPSPALTSLFGDAVPQVTNGEQAQYWGLQMIHNRDLRQRTGKYLYEQILMQHTWKHRLKQISDDTGIFD